MFLDEAAYLGRFSGANGLIGDACAYDLFSSEAARAIHEHRPDARILICVRNPIEQMRSWHNVRVGLGAEDLDFQEALEAEPERALGRRLPRNAYLVPMYQYRAVARFEEQVTRYRRTFGSGPGGDLSAGGHARLTCGCVPSGDPFSGPDDWQPESFDVVNSSFQIEHRTALRMLTDERLIGAAKGVVPRPLHGLARRIAMSIRDRTSRRA